MAQLRKNNVCKLLNEKRARRDYFGAFGPLASLTLGSPCGRSTSPDGEVVELALFMSAVRIFANRLTLTISGIAA
jgi:hypothetical protein